MSLHSRSRRQTSMPSMSGSTRSTIAASGGRTAARSSASSPRLGRDRLEARLAQHDLQRARDLRLVVADEDPPARRARGLTSGTGGAGRGAGQGDDEARPLAGQRLDVHAAAVGLDEALDDRQAEARSRCRGRPARGRRARRCAAGRPAGCRARGPRSGRAGGRHSRGRGRTRGTRRSGDSAFSSRLANARSSWAASASISGRLWSSTTA